MRYIFGNFIVDDNFFIKNKNLYFVGVHIKIIH
jgi:hypothetical protein